MDTTLAAHVRDLFQRFANVAAASNTQIAIQVIECWRRTLTLQNGPTLLEALASVDVRLLRLREQVNDAKLLDTQSRNVAVGVVDGLCRLVDPAVFHAQVQQFQQSYHADRLGTLGMLANTLRLEFPEADPPKDEIDALAKDIDELVGAISEADLPPRIKPILMRHASFLAWAIRNVDILGVEGVYDAIGRALVAAARLPESEVEEPDKPGIRNRLVGAAKRVLQLISYADKADQHLVAIQHIAHDVGHIAHEVGSLLS